MGESNIPFSELFEDDDEIILRSKIYSSLIWHEVGHVIGYKIAVQLGCNFDGKFTELRFHANKGNPAVKHNFTLYEPQSPNGPEPIYNPELYWKYALDDEKKIIESLTDKSQFFKYLIFLLSGGLFHIYYFQKQPSKKDLNNCFMNPKLDLDKDHFYGQGGADWTKLRSLSRLKNWDVAIFKDYRMGLFKVMKSHRLFEEFKDLIAEVDSEYNGLSVTEASEIQEILNKIELRLSPFDELKSDLQNLIEKFQIKLAE